MTRACARAPASPTVPVEFRYRDIRQFVGYEMSLGNQSKLNAGSFAGGGIARKVEIQYAQSECKQKQRAQEKFSEQRAATAVLAIGSWQRLIAACGFLDH